MCCSEPVIRILKIIFIALLLCTGIAFIAGGAYINSDENSYIDLTGSNLNQVAILFIVVGSFVVVVSLLGCFWIFKKVDYALYVYLVMLFILCIMEFSGGIAALVYQDDIAGQVTSNLGTSIVDYNPDANDKTTKQWDNMQRQIQCCGTVDYKSWSEVSKYKTIPESCCTEKGCSPDPTAVPPNIYMTGCIVKVTDELEDNASILGGLGIGLALLQLIGLAVTGAEVLLARCLKKVCCCCCDDK